MTFPKDVSFPSSVSFPSQAYYPGQVVPILPPDETPVPTPTPDPISAYHADTVSWGNRSIADRGVVDTIDLQAIDEFVQGIYDLGLRDAVGSDHTIIELMPLAGGNLPSCLTKLWYLPNVPSKAANVNFVESDYNRTTGLTGNGVDKYLSSGLNLAAQGITNSVALGVYNRTNGGFDAVEIGVELAFPDRLYLQVEYSDGIGSLDCFSYNNGRCAVDFNNSDSTGFILGSRNSSADSRFYRNGNQIAAISTSGGNVPNADLTYYRANGPTYPTTSPRSLGLIMVCRRGIPPEKVRALNNLVSSLMTALGRAVEMPPFAYHADTISWRDRTGATGSTVTDNQLMALNTFVESCYDLGLRDRTGNNHIILDLMPFMGSNLRGALTKLWFIPSAPTVVDYFFGAEDYTNETGLTTNRDKFLQSNIFPSETLDINSVSLGVYSLASVSSEGADFTADIPNLNLDLYSRLLIHNSFSDNTIYFDAGNVTAGRTTASSNGDTKGLVVGSRINANNTKIFRRGVQIGQSTVSGGQLPNVNLLLLTSPIAKPFGLMFVGRGIPEEKQSALSNIVHNLMVAIGRNVSL